MVMRVTTQAEVGTEPRIPLSRERVLRAAVKVADDSGIESLTMRRLAEELGAEAMSLYYHVAKKEDVLNGIAEVVAGEINDVVDRIDAPAGGPIGKRPCVGGSCRPARSYSAIRGHLASSRPAPP